MEANYGSNRLLHQTQLKERLMCCHGPNNSGICAYFHYKKKRKLHFTLSMIEINEF